MESFDLEKVGKQLLNDLNIHTKEDYDRFISTRKRLTFLMRFLDDLRVVYGIELTDNVQSTHQAEVKETPSSIRKKTEIKKETKSAAHNIARNAAEEALKEEQSKERKVVKPKPKVDTSDLVNNEGMNQIGDNVIQEDMSVDTDDIDDTRNTEVNSDGNADSDAEDDTDSAEGDTHDTQDAPDVGSNSDTESTDDDTSDTESNSDNSDIEDDDTDPYEDDVLDK